VRAVEPRNGSTEREKPIPSYPALSLSLTACYFKPVYQAIKGNGGTVRYVTLPYEAHGYVGLESVEHTLWEMLTWYDRWVKNAPPSASLTAK
jgi:hypothetical protein